jgi:hypothetical protein
MREAFRPARIRRRFGDRHFQSPIPPLRIEFLQESASVVKWLCWASHCVERRSDINPSDCSEVSLKTLLSHPRRECDSLQNDIKVIRFSRRRLLHGRWKWHGRGVGGPHNGVDHHAGGNRVRQPDLERQLRPRSDLRWRRRYGVWQRNQTVIGWRIGHRDRGVSKLGPGTDQLSRDVESAQVTRRRIPRQSLRTPLTRTSLRQSRSTAIPRRQP